MIKSTAPRINKMLEIRWKNLIPPTLPGGGYEFKVEGVWQPCTVAEVRLQAQSLNKMIKWN